MVVKPDQTVLCVDDELAQRSLCARLMQKLGYRVVTASSVVGAIEILRNERIALILMDIHMPQHSGFDALKVLKSMPSAKEVPVIIVSNSADPKDRERAMAMGAAEYVGPPVRDEHIEEAVKRVAAGSHG